MGLWEVLGWGAKIKALCNVGWWLKFNRLRRIIKRLRVLRASVAVAFLLLVSLPAIAAGATTSQGPWIDPSTAYAYASNMVDSYNALVRQTIYHYSNFSTYVPSLSLWGGDFTVIVVRSLPNDNNGTTFIFCVGPPLCVSPSNDLQVAVDNNLTRSDLLPSNSSYQSSMGILPTPYGFAYENVGINLTGTIVQIPLIWSTATWSVLAANASIYSKDAAVSILAADEQTAGTPCTFGSTTQIIACEEARASTTSTSTTLHLTDNFGTTQTVQGNQPTSPSDVLNTVASIIFLVIIGGGAIGALRSKRTRKKLNDWLHGG